MLGATVVQTTTLLSKDFLVLVLIAFFIATPVSWWCMKEWLQGFAYRTEISVWIYIAAGGGALVIAILTIVSQAVKAALSNPAESLRTG